MLKPKSTTNKFASAINSLHFSKFLLILATILILPLIYRYIVGQVQKIKEQKTEQEKLANFISVQNPTTRDQVMNTVTSDAGVKASAMKIVKGLGINYYDNPTSCCGWLNPRGWTENDDDVANEVIYQRKNYKLLQQLYYKLTNSRDLSSDLLDLLDSDSLKRVQKYIKLT